MANKTVVLYQHIKIEGKWKCCKVDPSGRLRRLSEGEYYIGSYEGTRKRMEPLGPDSDVAIVAFDKKVAELQFIATGGEVKQDESKAEHVQRVKVSKAVEEYIDDCRDRQGNPSTGSSRECSASSTPKACGDVDESVTAGLPSSTRNPTQALSQLLTSPNETSGPRRSETVDPVTDPAGTDSHTGPYRPG